MAFLVIIKRALAILNILYQHLIFSLLDFFCHTNAHDLCLYLYYAERLSEHGRCDQSLVNWSCIFVPTGSSRRYGRSENILIGEHSIGLLSAPLRLGS